LHFQPDDRLVMRPDLSVPAVVPMGDGGRLDAGVSLPETMHQAVVKRERVKLSELRRRKK
jgi:hypothetical protein